MVHDADGPRLRSADLACPVCAAEFVIADGEARFGEPVLATDVEDDSAPDAMRLAALLGVAEGQLPIMLYGRYVRAGSALASFLNVPQVRVNGAAPNDDSHTNDHLSSRLQVGARLPLGVATVAAVAIDARHATPEMLASVMRAVRQGGRVVAPVSVSMPTELRELARDAEEWVGEVTTRASGLIELRRRAPKELS